MKNRNDNKPRVLVLEGLSGTARAMRRAGAEVLSVPPIGDEVLETIEKFQPHAIALTGGGDVDPRLYDQRPHREVYGVSEDRDLAEWLALDEAERLGLFVFGICRGSQLINVHAGGTLEQHVPDVVGHHSHSHSVHLVAAEPATLLRRAFRNVTADVKSLHHQAVQIVAPGFIASGHAPDGTVEAIESRDGRVLGVQFHPEMMAWTNPMRRLFEHFVADVAEASGTVAVPDKSQVQGPSKKKAKRPAKSASSPGGRKLRAMKNSTQLTLDLQRETAPPLGKLICLGCRGMEFDSADDFIDHKLVLHREDVLGWPDDDEFLDDLAEDDDVLYERWLADRDREAEEMLERLLNEDR